jgi:c(7)-type cytochrome triheme protein
MKKFLFFLSVLIFVSGYGRLYASGALSHGGEIVYTKPVKSVIFSHKLHAEDRGLSCGMCHSSLFDAIALKAQQKSDFNMDSLYKGKYCGACHNGQMAFASNTQCARCHTGVKGLKAVQETSVEKAEISAPEGFIIMGKGVSSVRFSHEKHISFNTCGICHSAGLFPMSKGDTKITMEEIYNGSSCGSCHNGKKAFSSYDCNKCHEKPPVPHTDLTYKNKGIGAVKFSHNVHAPAFKCNECHKKLFVMKKGGSRMKMDAMYNGKFCGACHNGNTASNVMECDKCHKG